MPWWHVSQKYRRVESHEHSIFFSNVPSMGPRLPGICKYDKVVEVMWPRTNTWGLGMQKLAEVATVWELKY